MHSSHSFWFHDYCGLEFVLKRCLKSPCTFCSQPYCVNNSNYSFHSVFFFLSPSNPFCWSKNEAIYHEFLKSFAFLQCIFFFNSELWYSKKDSHIQSDLLIFLKALFKFECNCANYWKFEWSLENCAISFSMLINLSNWNCGSMTSNFTKHHTITVASE